MILQKISSLVAQTYITYCQRVPNHRGRQRFAMMLDNIFGSFICKTASGQSLEIYLSSSMDMSYFQKDVNYNSSHEEIIQAINKLELGDVFIDIGANIGFFALLASKIVGSSGRVFAFEPSRREYKRLLHNIQINFAENIMPYNIALANYNGEAQFLVSSSGHTGINRLDDRAIPQDFSKELVPVFTGDTVLNHSICENSTARFIIKIDVEGAEFSVILGMGEIINQSNVKIVIVEITPKFLQNFGNTKEEIYSLMSSFGFLATVNSSEWQYDELFIRAS
jgi:FkbM family methyltransferase